jgi:transposase
MAQTITSNTGDAEFAAFAAIDWADQKHFWRLLESDSQQQEHGELENTPEAIDCWATKLYERFGGRPVAVCLEQSRGPLVYMLAKYAHLRLFPVHPKTAAKYRETFCPSGAKSDAGDTASLLDLLLKHREQLRELQPDTPETRLLRLLVEGRRQLVNEKTRQKNRLTACLKTYFPQVLQWFDAVDSPLVGAVLERFGSLSELQRAHPGTLRKFFHQHNCRSEERTRERIAAIQQAMPATQDAAIIEGACFQARALAAVIATLWSQIRQFERRIGKLVGEHPEASLFASLPGAGDALVPRLIVAFGTRRERWETAYQMQCFSGIGPVREASGGSSWVHFRWACPKFLRQTFHEFAGHSIRFSEWARAFYDAQIAKKKSHHAAVRALAFRWIRVIFRCWKDRKPYDEQTYMRSLQRRGSPLIGSFLPATSVGWKSVAGFQKISDNPS